MEEAKFHINLKSDGSVIMGARSEQLAEFEALIVVTKELYNKHFAGSGAAATTKSAEPELSPAAKAKQFLEDAEKASREFSKNEEQARAKEVPADITPVCKFCGSALWDNTKKKLTPKSPDYKCKNKECNAAAWYKGGQLSWSKK